MLTSGPFGRYTWGAIAVILAALLGGALALASTSYALLAAASLAVALIILLRFDVFTATLVIVICLIQDWYGLAPLPVRFPVLSLVVAFALLAVLFFDQSPEHPWVPVPGFWIWVIFVLACAPHILQSVNLLEGVKYFAQVPVTSALLWILGVQLIRTPAQLRQLLAGLAAFGALIAVHSIIFSLTGDLLLATPDAIAHLASTQNFKITNTVFFRAGSFIGSPDWNGVFLAMLAFLPLALLIEARSAFTKAVYVIEFILIVLALLFTYSTAAWLALAAGLVAFLYLARNRSALLVVGALLIGVPVLILVIFPGQAVALLGHVTAQGQLSLRLGAWETGLRVMLANPLTGIGLGGDTYILRAAPYRSPLQTIELGHPHNAYLELGAAAGIPIMLFFLALLALSFRRMLKTASVADRAYTPLLAGGIACLVSLAFNSIAINGWTLFPLAAIGWLLAGALASPALQRAVTPQRDAQQEAPQTGTTGSHADARPASVWAHNAGSGVPRQEGPPR
jgi:O-antigen ligase